MKVVDLNILLYAVNRDDQHHAAARAWLEDVLNGDEPIGLPWVVLLGFLRIATNPRVFARPLTSAQAMELVDAWLERPAVIALAPGDEHWRILRSLIADARSIGAIATDAHLAALAIENGAELCSADADFRRFEGLRWSNPIAG
jgi:toxin-antitoxin system PIN domain toxin